MAKETVARKSAAMRHDPMSATKVAGHKAAANSKLGVSKKEVTPSSHKENNDADEFLDTKTSKKILELARRQQDELEDGNERKSASRKEQGLFERVKESNEQPLEDEGSDYEAGDYSGDDGAYLDDFDDFAAQYEIDEKDQALIEKFMAPEPKQQVLLSDIIMQKLEQHQQMLDSKAEEAEVSAKPFQPRKVTFSDKIMDVYTKVGLIMSRYRSGKVPKMFKVIPSLADWEDVLLVTSPETWSPQATYQATRIFVSNLKDKQAQRFFSVFLVPKIRDDIQQNKKLNYHYYMALKKALYKPGAFFKGILLPMCESGSCTLQEAVIVGSVLSKVSIPVLHSAAAILKLAEMDYSGPNSLFIRIFLDKKYALPFKVVDSLVFHFLRFRTDSRELPLLWHQCLLVFAQRYKQDIAPDQKDALLDLCKVKYHPHVTEEIRRELASVDNTSMVVVE